MTNLNENPPFPTWIKNNEGYWEPPIPRKENDKWWNESTQMWMTEGCGYELL